MRFVIRVVARRNASRVIARSAERATRQSLPNTKRASFYRDCFVARSALLAMTAEHSRSSQ
ncbi:MAG: hypothetical protein LBL66_11220 [Clostridiales bacterium]|nr:hypothetical protein [Clostridiales bacterium]